MNFYNYSPVQVLSNRLYMLYVGFESTHPKADERVKGYLAGVHEAMGEPFVVLLDRLTNARLAEEGETNDLADFDKEFKALDALVLDKRPTGWVSSGNTYGLMQAPNLSTMLLWLRGGIDTYNTDPQERLNDGDILLMLLELREALPNFGDPTQPWVLKWAPDENAEPSKEFLPSNVSDSVFCMDDGCERMPYAVNGKFVQFPCPMGWVTVWQGEAA